MKIFSAQLKGTTIVVSGSTASITGSFTGSIAGIDINETNQFTASTIARLSSIETISSSNDSRVNSLESFTSSTELRLDLLETHSESVNTTNTAQNSRLDSLENLTGSLATTGSNTFYGQQVFSGSLYVQDNLIVQGSSSLQNITASAVSIGTNIVYLNTDTPAVRFAGLTVQDSGSSAGVTGSMLWDSLCNRWIYSNPSTVGYSGGMLLSGPRAANLGEETTLTCNYIAKSGGGDHLYNSCIIDDGTTVCVNANLKSNSNACITSICSPSFVGGTVNGTTGVFSSSTTAANFISDGTAFYAISLKGRASDNYGAIGFYSNNGATRTGYIQYGTICGGQVNITGDGGGSITLDNRGIIATGVACFSNTICAPIATINCLGAGAAWSTTGGTYQPIQIKSALGNSGLWVESCSSDAGAYINMAGNCVAIGQSYRTSAGYNDILFQTAGSTRMIVRCAGNVEVQTGIISPMFMIERNSPWGDITTGQYLDLNDAGNVGLNAKFHQQFAPYVNSGEGMTWNFARVLVRITSNTGTFSQSLAGCIRNASYFYLNGWSCFGPHVQVGTTMDSNRGFKWIVMPWFGYSDLYSNADVPGFGLYNQFSDIGLRIGAVYLQYKT
jgi:hypothetical protein